MGMTKLPLHERLRKWAGMALSRNGYASHIALEDMNLNSGEAMAAEAKLFHVFSNEIERDYILKGSDADGNHWKIEDECIVDGESATIVGYGDDCSLFVYLHDRDIYIPVSDTRITRQIPRTSIEKVRDEIKDCAEFREHITYSLLDGWVKDLTAYIDQQGKDE